MKEQNMLYKNVDKGNDTEYKFNETWGNITQMLKP